MKTFSALVLCCGACATNIIALLDLYCTRMFLLQCETELDDGVWCSTIQEKAMWRSPSSKLGNSKRKHCVLPEGNHLGATMIVAPVYCSCMTLLRVLQHSLGHFTPKALACCRVLFLAGDHMYCPHCRPLQQENIFVYWCRSPPWIPQHHLGLLEQET